MAKKEQQQKDVQLQGKSKIGRLFYIFTLIFSLVVPFLILIFTKVKPSLPFTKIIEILLFLIFLIEFIRIKIGRKVWILRGLTYIHEKFHAIPAELLGYRVTNIETEYNEERKSRGFCDFENNKRFEPIHFCIIIISPLIMLSIIYIMAISLVVYFRIPSFVFLWCLYVRSMYGCGDDIIKFFEVILSFKRISYLKYTDQKFYINFKNAI